METEIKTWAQECGFDAVGLTPVETPGSFARYEQWIEDGHHGTMDYLSRHRGFKKDARTLLSGAQSWIVCASGYDTNEELSVEKIKTPPEGHGWVARYARGRDYHKSVRKKLKLFLGKLSSQFPAAQFRAFVDSGPVLERDLAFRAGLGWIGKNTCVIDEKRGSFFFISEILTTLKLEPNLPASDRCGNCSHCLDICPTGALEEPRKLIATKCISYWTIESKELETPKAIRKKMGAHLFGCDLCQDVCPWNQKVRRELKLPPGLESGWKDLRELIMTDNEILKLKLSGTPLARAGVEKLKARAREILVQKSSSKAVLEQE